MHPPPAHARDRSSESPIAIDLPRGMDGNRKRSILGLASYLGAGALFALVVIFAAGIGRKGNASAAEAGPLTDPVMRLHAREIGSSCWRGYERLDPARLTVSLQVGVDGKVRYAAASGETTALRSCVEAHVKSWEFLPQQAPQSMALPFEVDRR